MTRPPFCQSSVQYVGARVSRIPILSRSRICHLFCGPATAQSCKKECQNGKRTTRIHQNFCFLCMLIQSHGTWFHSRLFCPAVTFDLLILSGRVRKAAGEVQLGSRRDCTIFRESRRQMCWGICSTIPRKFFFDNHIKSQDLEYLPEGNLVNLKPVTCEKMKKMIALAKVLWTSFRLPVLF